MWKGQTNKLRGHDRLGTTSFYLALNKPSLTYSNFFVFNKPNHIHRI
ncbi:hypothetical protein SLEP1_g14546 [Rubroshorea leprosula]|uniref:Uncharacterized protein n=1 Tax=Rubroshorea leprosula TaxID=152421 RepID=A0AAV5IW09_9ROSI|nr:hypothetical protein SLEP1_g14546 [Rubroshorea leprosula]